MKFHNVHDIDSFFKEVEQCEGRVELVTKEGDRLNLKSQLARIVAYANVFSGGNIPEMELLTSEPKDLERLMMHMVKEESR